jgi:predicted RNA-binding protein
LSVTPGGRGFGARSYWLDLFTGTTWEEFLAAGGEVSGFRERRWKTVQQMKPGDYLLCYLTGIDRWIGVLEVVSEPFKDTTPIWKDEAFPARVRVRPVATLSPETAVPVLELRDELTVFRDLKNPNAWTGHFRGSPAGWKPADGQAVVAAILDAKANPITRPVDAAKLARRPRALRAAIGPVTVPTARTPPKHPSRRQKERRSWRPGSRPPTPRSSGACSSSATTWAWTSGSPVTTAAATGKAIASLTCPDSGPTFPCSSMRPPTGTIELVDVLWLTKAKVSKWTDQAVM